MPEKRQKGNGDAEETKDLESFFKEIFAHAEETLERTPELLPVLKEAGVVDSGGQDCWRYTGERSMASWAKR